VYKYLYCGRLDDTQDYLSDKICCYTIRIRKKIVRKTKRVFVYEQLIIFLGNGLATIQAIGLPIVPTTPSIIRAIHSNAGFSKKVMIAQVIKDMPVEIDFTKREIDPLYHLSVECRNNSINREELIGKINNLRGSAFVDVVAALGLIGAMIIFLTNDWSLAFQPNLNAIISPHFQWLYGNHQPGYSSPSLYM
jgi:hypothetical protein